MTPALVLLGLLLAGPPEKLVFSADPAASAVRFHVVHKLHKVEGSSRSVEGKAVLEPDGRVMAMVRIPIASFDSGDANRDAHMRETLEQGRFPHVVFKGVSKLVGPLERGASTNTTLAGELEFHGMKQRVEVPVSIAYAADGSAGVRGTMKISLEAYRVERPSLLFVKVDDDCRIEFDLRMRNSP